MRAAAAATVTLALAAAACSDGTTADLRLHLADDSPACLGVQLGMVRSVEVIAIGAGVGGAPCRLDGRCVEVTQAANLANLDAQLAAAGAPLLEVSTAAFLSVRVLGFPSGGCAGAVNLCGVADASAAVSGGLTVPTVCDGRLSERCPVIGLPVCP